MLQIRALNSLAGADYNWLKTKHHFALPGRDNSTHHPLGSLIVLNDDQIAPGTGFGMHGHSDMEIVTYVREGLLEHEDTTGGRAQITAGNVQAFSAGTGIRHAEYNPGDVPLKIFQIWLQPRRLGVEPRWATKPFPKALRANRWDILASGYPHDEDAIAIEADARILGATITHGESISYKIDYRRYGYLVVACGVVKVNGLRLESGDGLAAMDIHTLVVSAIEDAEVVLIDVS